MDVILNRHYKNSDQWEYKDQHYQKDGVYKKCLSWSYKKIYARQVYPNGKRVTKSAKKQTTQPQTISAQKNLSQPLGSNADLGKLKKMLEDKKREEEKAKKEKEERAIRAKKLKEDQLKKEKEEATKKKKEAEKKKKDAELEEEKEQWILKMCEHRLKFILGTHKLEDKSIIGSDDLTTKKCLEVLHRHKMKKLNNWLSWIGLNKDSGQKKA